MTIPDENEHLEHRTGMANPTYRNNRRKNKKPFNFELDQTRRNQLHELANHRGISMGAALRQLISTAHLMDVSKQPTCASGRACFMPHLHPQAPPIQPAQDNTP